MDVLQLSFVHSQFPRQSIQTVFFIGPLLFHGPTELINPHSVISGATPEMRETEHFFFDLPAFYLPLVVLKPLSVSKFGAYY